LLAAHDLLSDSLKDRRSFPTLSDFEHKVTADHRMGKWRFRSSSANNPNLELAGPLAAPHELPRQVNPFGQNRPAKKGKRGQLATLDQMLE